MPLFKKTAEKRLKKANVKLQKLMNEYNDILSLIGEEDSIAKITIAQCNSKIEILSKQHQETIDTVNLLSSIKINEQ